MIFVASAFLFFSLLAGEDPKDKATADRELQKSVDEAVRKGLDWVKQKQNQDGGYGEYHASKVGRVYIAGPTAIALLAMSSCGEPKNSHHIKEAVDFLMLNRPMLTYELGLSLMALDAKAAPTFENQELETMSEKERRKYDFPRNFSDEEKVFLKECVDKLLKNRRNGLWSYGDSEENSDTSNTQFALLGLKAAARCKVQVPGDVWNDALQYFLQFQLPKGAQIEFPETKSKSDNFYMSKANPRGWAYWHGDLSPNEVYGSRVNIGICCLLMSREELELRRENAALFAKLKTDKFDKAVHDATGWLATNFAVDINPPKGEFLYYYLYSLERMGVLTGKKYIGRHDWYREGAEYLIKAQNPDGSWPATGWSGELSNTCFALLFFRRATVPSITSGPR